MRVQILAPAVLLIVAIAPSMARSQSRGAPETFTANVHVKGETAGAGAATIQIHIQAGTRQTSIGRRWKQR